MPSSLESQVLTSIVLDLCNDSNGLTNQTLTLMINGLTSQITLKPSRKYIAVEYGTGK